MANMTDVARLAGVSLSTVSYALSGARPVSDATRERIFAAMEELDFTPNAVAQGLAGRRTRILAVVLPTDEVAVDPYTGAILVGAAEAARESGYHLLLWTEPADRASEIRDLVRTRLIDGAIVLAIQLDDPRIALLQEHEVPITMIGRTREPGGVPFVDADTDLVARVAVDHLADRGRERVAYVASAASDPAMGYGIAARLHDDLVRHGATRGVRIDARFAGRTAADGAASVAAALDADPELSGVLAFGDVMLGGCLGGVAATGRQVPDDVAVVGLLCTSFVAELVHPQATTVSPQPSELGRLGAEAIMRFLADDSVEQLLLPPELVVRRSS